MSKFEMELFEKKSKERDIRKLSVIEIDRIINNMSPIDFNLKYFDKYCERNNIIRIDEKYNKEKRNNEDEKYMEYIKEEIEMENNLYEMYEKADDEDNIDINYNDDIEFKNIDY